MSSVIHLITPPNSIKVKDYELKKAKKNQIINKYIHQASIYITSLFQTEKNQIISNLSYENFLREVLKRSRSSISIFQIAIYYFKNLQLKLSINHSNIGEKTSFIKCPKRSFLICLILSFKYNYDCNYSFKCWSKISGLDLKEIKSLEFQTLKLLNYDLGLSNDKFANWIFELNTKLNEFEPSQNRNPSININEINVQNINSKKREQTDVDIYHGDNKNYSNKKLKTV
ncbi:hypothetical protein WICMUC_003929 [Wickerhamomyces mucosus]|uniref:Cyclin N-terminal domain-containing protein n=1 Tax=Wickerhamomyces mucosus TaxID=1378264 RepID=A0A9P8TBJ9_9ASCO|nr:hypothetical protein WICMUC_003929 [Wickerhamomyces mucosus]